MTDYLSAAPLVRLVERRAAAGERLPYEEQVGRMYRRARHSGRAKAETADLLAIRLLGMHPSEVWGEEWTRLGEPPVQEGACARCGGAFTRLVVAKGQAASWCPSCRAAYMKKWKKAAHSDQPKQLKLSLCFPVRGKEHPNWGADQIGYRGAHCRVSRVRGAARQHYCPCGVQAREWALTGNPNLQEPSGKRRWYSSDPEQYTPLCTSCHRDLDQGQGTCS